MAHVHYTSSLLVICLGWQCVQWEESRVEAGWISDRLN
jgi:hypothetical protein